MLFLITDRIPSMVSHVIDNQVEVVGEEGPERVVEVDRQTVAMTQNEPRSRRVSMTPQTNDGVIVHADFINRKRLGDLPYRCRGRCQWNPLLGHERGRREFLVAKIFLPSVEETEICWSSNPGAWTRDFKSRHTHNNLHAKRLDQCFLNYQDIKNQCRLAVKHMPAGIPCTTACGLPWPEASKISCRFPQPKLHKKGIERHATQDKPASLGDMYVLLPTRQFFHIEPRQGTLLAGRMRRQIDMYNSSIANVTKNHYFNPASEAAVTCRRTYTNPSEAVMYREQSTSAS